MKMPESILTDELETALEREPEEVLAAVKRGELEPQEARSRFGVVVCGAPGSSDLAVDDEATQELRAQFRLVAAPHGGA